MHAKIIEITEETIVEASELYDEDVSPYIGAYVVEMGGSVCLMNEDEVKKNFSQWETKKC